MKFSAKKIPKVFSEMPKTSMSGCTRDTLAFAQARL